MIEDFFNWDVNVFLYFNNLGTPQWDAFWLFITEKETWIPLYILFIILLYLKFGWKKTLVAGICIALMITSADQFTNILKNGFQRFRPCHNVDIQGMFRAIGCEGRGKYGFTSAHASNHMAVAIFVGMVLKQHYKYLLYLLLVWALMIAYSRVYVGVHFTGDIFFGTIIGIIAGIVFFKLYQFILKKYKFQLEK